MRSIVVRPQEISQKLRREMIGLLVRVFENVRRESFERDLEEKDDVILLYEGDELAGFSTLRVFPHGSVRIVFSGDTVIHPRAWGSMELPLAWGEYLHPLLDEPGPLYWMLISKGVRTFKFLPAFFHEFYPSPVRETPEEYRRLLQELGGRLFGERYDPQLGLLLPGEESYFLRPEFAQVAAPVACREHEAFFLERNPTYRLGSELVCLTKYSLENVQPYYVRALMRRLASGARRHAA